MCDNHGTDYHILEDAMTDILRSSGVCEDRSSATNETIKGYINATNRLSQNLCIQDPSALLSFLDTLESNNSTITDRNPVKTSADSNDFAEIGSHPMQAVFDFAIQDEHKWQGTSSCRPATFRTKGQARHGSHHGRGGRLPGSGAQVRKNYSKYARSVIRNRLRRLITECSFEQALMVCEKMVRSLSSSDGMPDEALSKRSREVQEKLVKELEQSADDKLPRTMDHIPLCVIGVSARFSKSDYVQPEVGSIFNVRERHIVNTWLDRKGHIRCTCLGNTQYEIFALNEEFRVSCCVHAEAFYQTLKEICTAVFSRSDMPFDFIYRAFSLLQPELVKSDAIEIPLFRTLHDGNSGVLVCEDVCGGDQLCWVPIRRVQRSGGRFLCAFCDLINTNRCHHITELRRLCVEDFLNPSDPIQLNDEAQFENPSPNTDPETASRLRNHQPVSYLPVAPVNCHVALRVDHEICEILKLNGVFKQKAPTFCIYCHSPRIETSMQTNTSGFVMCSIGACSMEVDTYVCSSCYKTFSAEGRNEGIFVDSVCLAATHKLLRDQLTGFALGNGTLSGRLNQLHSQVTAFEDSKLFQSHHPCRSARKLYKLCVYFVRLMVCSPPKSLFVCSACQRVDVTTEIGNEVVKVPRAICVDGIWAGYLKKSTVPFENVSEVCNPIKSFSRSVKSSFHKPRTTFLRLEKTVTFLLKAIKGNTIEVSCSSINALSAAIRIVDETILPVNFYQTSVCGTFPRDYKYDIGQGCLVALRRLTCSLFDKNTLLYRLLEPLQKLFQRQGKRRKTGNNSSTKDHNNSLDVVNRCLNTTTSALQEDEGVCWKENVGPTASKGDLGLKMLQLFRAFLQGPITHLIRREEIESAKDVAQACKHYKAGEFMKAMVAKKWFLASVPEAGNEKAYSRKSGREDRSNLLKNVRTLTGGLFSAALVDSSAIHDSEQDALLLPYFGEVLSQAVQCVSEFYAFYDDHKRNGGSDAAIYARRWSSQSFSYLREKFVKLSTSDDFQPSWGIDYDDMYVTGAFFPSLPQVRPLPFNDKTSKPSDEDAFGFCSKHYLQRNASFTPGALTFACTCCHPIILGFKVLERDEGPRAVLDVLASRFPTFPWYVIYDFACGVYKSAINTLWWVVEDSTLVSDPFHGCNHTCSPAFLPTAHVPLNMTNTIAHEQRNRPISKIKGSLQQTSQDVYISLLAFQIIINNIEAKGRTSVDLKEPVPNRSAKDIEWAFFHRLQLTCPCCEVLQDYKS